MAVTEAIYTHAQAMSMSDTFEIDLTALQHLNLGSNNTYQSRTQVKCDRQIQRAMLTSSIAKFDKLCQTININSLIPISIHVILILNAKIKQKQQAVQTFCEIMCTDTLPILDWQFIESSADSLTSVFSSLSDWCQLLRYMQINVTDDAISELEQDHTIQRMKQSMEKAGLHALVAIDIKLILNILLRLIPSNINKIAMLQRVLQEHNVTSTNLEFRCSQCMTYFLDTEVDEKKAFDSLLLVLPCFETSPVFFSEVTSVLKKDSPSNDTIIQHKSNRLQMRYVSHDAQHVQYHNTYETWLTQQKFTVSMSKHLQLLLYFMHVQTVDIDFSKFSHLFPGNMLQKSHAIKVATIDVHAVVAIIKSLRVYLHNISNLIDFRVSCLQGLTRQLRESLSMSQILQLYVACYQHPSVVQECWRQIVSVWNHTTSSALQQFRQKHVFEIGPVLETVVHCQIHD
jgi:hypothetical protein